MKFEARPYFLSVIALLWAALPGHSSFAASVSGNKTLFSYQGKIYTQQELSPAVRQALYDAEKLRYDNVSRIIENAVLEEYLAAQAKKTGKSVKAVEEDTFKTDLSEKDAKQWYEENKARLGGRDFNSIKSEILHFLQRQEQEKIRESVVKRIKQEGKFSLVLQEPEAPAFEIATKGFPSKGPANAKITIVEFADYQCPHCKAASSSLKNILEKYKDKVKLIYLDFPLRAEGVSTRVAEGAVCADAQKKFWDYHYMAFEQQSSLTNDTPVELAEKLDLNLDKFKQCLESADTKKKVKQARHEGERLGVQGTPAIYLNGRKHAGYNEESLVEEIQKLL